MHHFFRRAGLTLLLVLLAAGVSTTRDQGAAADSPAEAQVRAAARTFANALGKGDAAAAKALCNGGEDNNRFIDAITSMTTGMQAFKAASEASFGPAARPEAQHTPADKLLLDIDTSIVHLDGDRATLSHPGQDEPLRMIKVDGQWKVAALADAAQLRMTAPVLAAIGTAARQTADEVKAGKYDTLDAARDALNAHIRDAVKAATQGKDKG